MINSFEAEKCALVGHRDAIKKIVGDLRKYRAISKKLIEHMNKYDEVNGAMMIEFEDAVDNIEDYTKNY